MGKIIGCHPQLELGTPPPHVGHPGPVTELSFNCSCLLIKLSKHLTHPGPSNNLPTRLSFSTLYWPLGDASDALLGVQFLSFSCSFSQKSCKTTMHSNRMRTARSLTVSRSIRLVGGESAQPPWMQTPLDADPPQADLRPLRIEGMTQACENITSRNYCCGR